MALGHQVSSLRIKAVLGIKLYESIMLRILGEHLLHEPMRFILGVAHCNVFALFVYPLHELTLRLLTVIV
ncbi:hypothetical protein MLD38_037020 [Melastoma candidum]|uniref:Uncharacterized protein n=2 Tax=Melastoma candidum TaxID=119954 RepID=A0ACB9LLZ9_9MYRT|nr:hypothetical protein MLD38_037017 [Melastoma candidum]KAI4312179.1 hypothetical protein MLD38_037020 [Melastoma candidum]